MYLEFVLEDFIGIWLFFVFNISYLFVYLVPVQVPHCWKSHVAAYCLFFFITHLVCSTRLGSIAVIEVFDWRRTVVALEG